MSINFILFDSAENFQKYVEQTIAEARTAMGSQMRAIDEVKRRHATSNIQGGRESQRIDVAGFKVLVNPSVAHELKIMEETFSTLQDRLTAFEKTRDIFPHIKDAAKVGLILEDGLPSGFMFYTNR